MHPLALRLIRSSLAAGAALALVSCATSTQDAAPVLARASQAMGTAQLNTLRYSAEGSGHTFGQAYKAGGAWPRITLHSVTRSIDYGSGSMRDEIVLSRAEPLGGGGYPLSGQQRNDQFVSGEIAWNQTGTTATPGPRFVADRMHQLWITPHGALKTALRGGARARRGATGTTAVAFELPGRFTATAFIDADGLVRRVESVFADPVLGDTPVVTTYQEYRDFGGVQLPMVIRQTMGGYPVLDLVVKDAQVNPSLAMPVPEAARNTAERVTSEKVADGVWYVAGGSHHSVAIELQDQLILVETPLNDARTQAVIEHVKGLVPGKPIRTAVNSHLHFDHAGGVRAAVAEGARSSRMPTTCAYFERAFAQTSQRAARCIRAFGQEASFRPVAEKLEIGDATRAGRGAPDRRRRRTATAS